MKRYVIILIIINITAAAVSVVASNTSMTNERVIEDQRQILFRLDQNLKEIETSYLHVVLDQLAHKAEASGLVKIETPKFVSQETVVGLLSP